MASLGGSVFWSVSAALIGVASPIVVQQIIERRNLHNQRRTLLDAGAATLVRNGSLPTVSQLHLHQMGVQRAAAEVPYIPRDAEQELDDAVRQSRLLLVVGHSMAGKSRLAAEWIRRTAPFAPILIPESAEALNSVATEGVLPAGVVVWLDELQLYLGAKGITPGLLERLLALPNSLVLATMRTRAYDQFRPLDVSQPPEWRVLRNFHRVGLARNLTDSEVARFEAAISDRHLIAAVQRYGLAEYLGGGPQAVGRFEAGATLNPVGYAIAHAAVDWRRTGMSSPVPLPVVHEVVHHYLPLGSVAPNAGTLEQGLRWATEKINETVSLVSKSVGDEIEAFDYLVDHVSERDPRVPDALWESALHLSDPSQSADVARMRTQHDARHSRGPGRPVGRTILAAGAAAAVLVLGGTLFASQMRPETDATIGLPTTNPITTSASSQPTEETTTPSPTTGLLPPAGSAAPTGSGDPTIDGFAVACEDGDMAACDDLFRGARDTSGSAIPGLESFFDYGYTCGDRLSFDDVADRFCVIIFPPP